MTNRYGNLAEEMLAEVMHDDGSVMGIDDFTNGYFAAAAVYAMLSLSEAVTSLKPVAAPENSACQGPVAITTIDQVLALPSGTKVLDREDEMWIVYSNCVVFPETDSQHSLLVEREYKRFLEYAPFTVIRTEKS
jgi:hypothetical protein